MPPRAVVEIKVCLMSLERRGGRRKTHRKIMTNEPLGRCPRPHALPTCPCQTEFLSCRLSVPRFLSTPGPFTGLPLAWNTPAAPLSLHKSWPPPLLHVPSLVPSWEPSPTLLPVTEIALCHCVSWKERVDSHQYTFMVTSTSGVEILLCFYNKSVFHILIILSRWPCLLLKERNNGIEIFSTSLYKNIKHTNI